MRKYKICANHFRGEFISRNARSTHLVGQAVPTILEHRPTVPMDDMVPRNSDADNDATPKIQSAFSTQRLSKTLVEQSNFFNLGKDDLSPRKRRILKSFSRVESKLRKVIELRAKDRNNIRSARRMFKNSNFLVKQMTGKIGHTFEQLLHGELRNHERKKQGKRWTLDDKVRFFLIVFFKT